MTGHAMKYVGMADRVIRELGPSRVPDDRETWLAVFKGWGLLHEARDELVEAERALVAAYGKFHEGLQLASRQSELAAKYLERVQWDLT